MKFHFALLSLSFLAIGSPACAASADAVGVRFLKAPAPERGAAVGVTLWHPADPGGAPVLVGDSAAFRGAPAVRDAPIPARAHPLVLLAHGGIRAAPNLSAWIASRLARRGYVVAAVQQPDPLSLKAVDAPREMWLRPSDLSAALTAIQSDDALSDRFDTSRVGGFLLGGASALSLVGARLDSEKYARSCDPGGSG